MRSTIMAAVVSGVLVAGSALAGDLPRKGAISGKFGWYAIGKVYELEKGHIAFVGEFSGPFIADSATGFMNGATVVCSGVNDIFLDSRESSAHGWCIATDGDGDKAYSVWKNNGPAMNRPGGDNKWVGGTGKYAGIQGQNKFDTTVSPHGAGVSVWHSGSYELQ